MKVTQPAGAATASGSMGGVTASRNRYGAYMRNKAMPVNPRSTLQIAQRNRFGGLSGVWSTLTDVQRTAWETYANALPRMDSLGVPIYPTGRNVFMGNNSLRLQAGLTTILAGPSALSTPALTLPTLTIVAGNSGSLAFTPSDSWDAVGGALMLFTSKPVAPTRNFFKGAYRYANKVAGAATPATSPATITLPYTYASGQKVYWKAVALTADGRVASYAYGFCLVS